MNNVSIARCELRCKCYNCDYKDLCPEERCFKCENEPIYIDGADYTVSCQKLNSYFKDFYEDCNTQKILIEKHKYVFKPRQKDIAFLQTLTKKQLLKVIDSYRGDFPMDEENSLEYYKDAIK